MAEAEAIAFHGWAFDASCWEPWGELLASKDISLQCTERGYFGTSRVTPVFGGKHFPKIILVHSFGLHLCSKYLLSRADLLIIFGGFLHFHPVATQYRRRSKLVLKQMMNNLQENPAKVVEGFYANTFKPQQPGSTPAGVPDKKRLLEDLRQLNTGEIDLTEMKKVDKICILHGFRDGIVPRAKGRELYESLHDLSRYFEVKDAGHALPFTHTDQCWKFIEPEIDELIS